MKKRITLTAATLLITLGAGLGATPAYAASSATSMTTQVGIEVVQTSTAHAANEVQRPSIPTPKPLENPGVMAEPRNPIFGIAARAFISAVKSVPGLFAKMLPVVKASLAKFIGWVKSIPAWIQAIISGLATNVIWEHIKGALGF